MSTVNRLRLIWPVMQTVHTFDVWPDLFTTMFIFLITFRWSFTERSCCKIIVCRSFNGGSLQPIEATYNSISSRHFCCVHLNAVIIIFNFKIGVCQNKHSIQESVGFEMMNFKFLGLIPLLKELDDCCIPIKFLQWPWVFEWFRFCRKNQIAVFSVRFVRYE